MSSSRKFITLTLDAAFSSNALTINEEKLFHHFENIDTHRLELPFSLVTLLFDSEVLIDWCLGHSSTLEILSHFNPQATLRPGKLNPGAMIPPDKFTPITFHISGARAIGTIWNVSCATDSTRTNGHMLKAKEFPTSSVSKNRLGIAAGLHYLGVRDYECDRRSAYLLPLLATL